MQSPLSHQQSSYSSQQDDQPLQSPLSSLARQASLSLSRQGSNTSRNNPSWSPRSSEQDESYFAPIFAENVAESARPHVPASEPRSSAYSHQTDSTLFTSPSHNVSHQQQQQRPLSGEAISSSSFQQTSVLASDRSRAKTSYAPGYNFSRPTRTSQRSSPAPDPSTPPPQHRPTISHDSFAQQRERAASNPEHMRSIPAEHYDRPEHLSFSTSSEPRPRHLSIKQSPQAQHLQRSPSKESVQSNASSTYISPTIVQPGHFNSQMFQTQTLQTSPFPDSPMREPDVVADPPSPLTPTEPPLRQRTTSSSGGRMRSNSNTSTRRNSRWKSFFSFRSDKDSDQDSDDQDDDADWKMPPSPSAAQILFHSQSDAPGIVFSPPNSKDKVVVPLNQAADVNWDELRRRRIAEAEAAAAMMRAEDGSRQPALQEAGRRIEHLGVSGVGSSSNQQNFQPSASSSTQDPRPLSVYSNYSYYGDLPESPGPNALSKLADQQQQLQQPQQQSFAPPKPPYDGTTGGTIGKAKSLLNVPSMGAKGNGKDDENRPLSHDEPMDCLMLGIQHHESGALERAAFFFERAASLKGGIGPGMLLWGLSLRHGWGVHADPRRGFIWIQRAADSVVGDLDGIVKRGVLSEDEHHAATESARHELVLAIYELGMCHRQGWGVKKDRKVALSYFELAASLGDADAQQELAFCYLKGKGTKVDKMKAAKFFRLAEAQGIKQWNQAWIHKPKWGGTGEW